MIRLKPFSPQRLRVGASGAQVRLLAQEPVKITLGNHGTASVRAVIGVGPPGPPGAGVNLLPAVADEASLPSVGNTTNDARMTEDTGHLWRWNGTAWIDAGPWRGPAGTGDVATVNDVLPVSGNVPLDQDDIPDGATAKQFTAVDQETLGDAATQLGVNVKSHGAVGDGVADDTVAIQAAIDAAGQFGTVIVPGGDYLISGVLSIPYDHFTFTGAGYRSTKLILKNGSNSGVISTPDDGVQRYGLQLRDFAIIGNAVNQTGTSSAILIRGMNEPILQSLYILEPRGKAIQIGQATPDIYCTVPMLRDLIIRGSDTYSFLDAIALESGSSDAQVIGCDIGFFGAGAGVLLSGHPGAVIIGTYCWQTRYGFQNYQAHRTRFVGCLSDYAKFHGYVAQESSDLQFDGCTSREYGVAADSTYDGFRFEGADGDSAENITLSNCRAMSEHGRVGVALQNDLGFVRVLGGSMVGQLVDTHVVGDNITDYQFIGVAGVTDEGDVGDSIPDQTGQGGKYLTTDGTDLAWDTPAGSGSGIVETIVAGTNVTVDDTDPANPIVSASGGGSGVVETVVAGSNIDVDSTDPANPVVSVEALTAGDITDFSTAADARVAAAVGASVQAWDDDLDDIAALSPSNGDVLQRTAGSWAARTMAQLKVTLGIAVADISDFASSVASAISTERTAAATYTNKDLTAGTNTFPTFNQNTTGSAAKWTTARTIALTGDVTYSQSVDGSANVTGAATLATVNSNTGSFGGASSVATFSVNGKGLITSAGSTAIALAGSAITSGTVDPARLGSGSSITTKFLRGDGTWQTIGGGGDMLASVYDPQAIGADAFDVDNHTDGTTNKVYTATEKTKLAGIEAGADVTDDAAVLAILLDGGSGSRVEVEGIAQFFASQRASAAQGALADSAVQDLSDLSITASAAELNIMDGVTSSTAELNILDGVTATAAELNVTDGLTANTTELNYVDGVTSAIQGQIDAKAPLASPALTGNPTAPTQSAGNNSTRVATTAYVDTADALKAPIASPTFTGTPVVPNAIIGEEAVAASGTSGTVTLDLSTSRIFTLTPTGNVTTLTISNWPSSQAATVTLVVDQGATARTIATPSGGKFLGAATPTQANNKDCIFTYFSADGGTTIYCAASQEV